MSLSGLNWSGSHSSRLGMRHGTNCFELRSRDFATMHLCLTQVCQRVAFKLPQNVQQPLPRASFRHLMLVGIQFLFCNHASLFHSATWRRGVVCELAMSRSMSLDGIAAVVREELLSPEQWTIVRCVALKLTYKRYR